MIRPSRRLSMLGIALGALLTLSTASTKMETRSPGESMGRPTPMAGSTSPTTTTVALMLAPNMACTTGMVRSGTNGWSSERRSKTVS